MFFPRLFAATLALCVSTPAAELDQSAYLPLTTGVEWTMDTLLVAPNGATQRMTGRRRVEGRVERDGKTYLRVRTWMEDAPVTVKLSKLARKDEKGFHSILEDVKDAKEEIEVPLPMKVGNTWKRQAGTIALTESVVGIETVTVGDKTYKNCFHVVSKADNGNYREDYWEAPDVGSVKSEIVHADGTKMTLTLREFKPAK